MSWLHFVSTLVVGATALFSAPHAWAATSCSVTSTTLEFNSALPGGDTTATISYRCSTDPSSGPGSVTMCFAIGAGTPPSTIAHRVMTAPSGEHVGFQIYKDPARTQIWGDSAAQPGYQELKLKYPSSNSQVSGDVTIYGRAADLSQVTPASYRSEFTDARMIYSYREGNDNPPSNCNQGNKGTIVHFPFAALVTAPPNCSVIAAGEMSFNPGGMPLAGTNTGNLTASSTVELTCTNRTAWQVGLDDGLNPTGGTRRMCNPGGACVAYELTRADGTTPWGDTLDVDTVKGRSSGAQQSLTVKGRVNDQPLTQAGRYSDTVKVILTY